MPTQAHARDNGFSAEHWSALCRILRERQVAPGFITTWNSPDGVRNWIRRVDEDAGEIALESDRSRSGGPRVITLGMLRRPRGSTSHGVILETLRLLVGEVGSAGWSAPQLVRDLLQNCWTEGWPWPPQVGTALVVARYAWTGSSPDPACDPILLDVPTQPQRFEDRFGALVADLLGFFGRGSGGHHPHGTAVYAWCEREDVNPLDLHVAWLGGSAECVACFAANAWRDLRPRVPTDPPPDCAAHPSVPPPSWEGIAGSAGRCDDEELKLLLDRNGDPALARATR